MRLLIVALAALPLSAAAAETGRPVQLNPEDRCPKPLVHKDAPRPKAELKKLNKLPPADAFHAVYRLDANGCIDPVMVGYQYKRER